MGNYRAYTLPYRVMSSFALVNSWSSFAATARQIAALDGESANKCGRMTHIVATAIWSDDITYYIILYGLKIMKQMQYILCKSLSKETEPSSGRL